MVGRGHLGEDHAYDDRRRDGRDDAEAPEPHRILREQRAGGLEQAEARDGAEVLLLAELLRVGLREVLRRQPLLPLLPRELLAVAPEQRVAQAHGRHIHTEF